MSKNFIGFFDKSKSYNEYDKCIVIYDRKDYYGVWKSFHNFNSDLDYWFSINWDGHFYDILVFYKETIDYKPIYLLREVNTPFKVVNKETGLSEARGWFYDINGKPVRYTGLGNSLYFSKDPKDTDFSERALYLFNFCFFNNEEVESNIKSYKTMIKNIDFYKESPSINEVQDNSIKDYKKDGKFHFGVI